MNNLKKTLYEFEILYWLAILRVCYKVKYGKSHIIRLATVLCTIYNLYRGGLKMTESICHIFLQSEVLDTNVMRLGETLNAVKIFVDFYSIFAYNISI